MGDVVNLAAYRAARYRRARRHSQRVQFRRGRAPSLMECERCGCTLWAGLPCWLRPDAEKLRGACDDCLAPLVGELLTERRDG